MFSDVETAVILQSARNESAIRDRGQAIINDKVEKIRRLEQEVEVLREALIQEIAHSAGLTAQVIAMRDRHGDSPLRKTTGLTLPDGRPQRVITTIYEKAFDEKARELGVQDPTQIRQVAR
jgi:hypothetical protein